MNKALDVLYITDPYHNLPHAGNRAQSFAEGKYTDSDSACPKEVDKAIIIAGRVTQKVFQGMDGSHLLEYETEGIRGANGQIVKTTSHTRWNRGNVQPDGSQYTDFSLKVSLSDTEQQSLDSFFSRLQHLLTSRIVSRILFCIGGDTPVAVQNLVKQTADSIEILHNQNSQIVATNPLCLTSHGSSRLFEESRFSAHCQTPQRFNDCAQAVMNDLAPAHTLFHTHQRPNGVGVIGFESDACAATTGIITAQEAPPVVLGEEHWGIWPRTGMVGDTNVPFFRPSGGTVLRFDPEAHLQETIHLNRNGQVFEPSRIQRWFGWKR